jgi:hypothetical protein
MRRETAFSWLEVIFIIILAVFPVFMIYPYRVNIFISWVGAYRMSRGEVPFTDFGIPMGYMFWAMPALIFKIFGPQMITLVKAQALLNILSGLAFRSILRSFRLGPVIRLASVVFFVLTYSLVNFWPWYNHSVIVYELISLAFLMAYLLRVRKSIWLILAAVFCFISFFTKQDGGGICLLISLVLLGYDAFMEGKWTAPVIYVLAVAATAALMILPLFWQGFSFWFNLGQPPHSSRVSLADILTWLLTESKALRMSMIFIALLGFALFYRDRKLFWQKDRMLWLLLVLGMLAQAVILQETSYTPPDNNIYYLSFVCAWMLWALAELLPLPWNSYRMLAGLCLGILLMQSGRFSGYVSSLLMPAKQQSGGILLSPEGENMVGKDNYLLYLGNRKDIPPDQWVPSRIPVFRNMILPRPTVEGMDRILAMEECRKKDPKVLNMTELTPLAAAVPFTYDRGIYEPLWHHLGVSMFNRQAQTYEDRIAGKYYDIVLFEYIPGLNNFFPFRIRDSLQKHYRKVDSFYAPRMGQESMGTVEVYRR